jgi:hypothetical protein
MSGAGLSLWLFGRPPGAGWRPPSASGLISTDILSAPCGNDLERRNPGVPQVLLDRAISSRACSCWQQLSEMLFTAGGVSVLVEFYPPHVSGPERVHRGRRRRRMVFRRWQDEGSLEL